jgi:KDO2-lipid IV(A) lauroyltransferase
MDTLLYGMARFVVAGFQALPLRGVARIGRALGAAAYWLDGRHRRVAARNLERCFGGEKSPAELRALARENFKRIGENFCCATRTAKMGPNELRGCCELVDIEKLLAHGVGDHSQNVVAALGHFGNFELYAHLGQLVPSVQCATTYRGLRQPGLNRLLQSLREHSGCRFFERRTDLPDLKAIMNESGVVLGFLADQHGGNRGVRLPFFGHECLCSAAPAIFALRYQCPLHTAVCFRVGLGRWRIETGDEIPTHEGGQPRAVEAITADINRAFETAIRRDPANWFWVHNRWKTGRPGTPAARDAIAPVTTDDLTC